jgi:hypothetical protein
MKKRFYVWDKSSGASSPSRDSSEYFQYVKRLSSAKRENQELRDGLRGINRSLDKIIKESKTPLRFRCMDTRADSEQNLSHQIESTELLITKYKKEINSLKATTSFDNQDEKSQLIIKVSTLKTKLAELEKENSKLKTNEKNLKRFDGTEAKKVIQDYKNRIIKLSELIKEDDEAIFLFKNNVKNLKKVASQKMNSIDSTSTIQELENRISDLEKQKKTEESIWRQKILM